METQFYLAQPEDYDEVIDFANYVFSQAHDPVDFPGLLPKLYRREYFLEGMHYLARERGRIKGLVGAYPLEWEFPEGSLPGRGIGMVSVHPYHRSKGYMQVLMNMALEDMKRDKIVFSCLGGQRQRYAYFGYTPAGSAWFFTCQEKNILHTLGRQWDTNLSLRPVSSGDGELLDRIQALHDAKPARIKRRRDRLFDILSSWKTEIFTVYEGNRFEGYFLAKNNKNQGNHEITEINLTNPARLPEAIGLFLRRVRYADTPSSALVRANPLETDTIAALSSFAEEYRQSSAYQFAVFDYPRFLDPFLKLRARERVLTEGSFVLELGEAGERILLEVSAGTPQAKEANAPVNLQIDRLAALRFLSSAPEVLTAPAVRNNSFLQSLLPLPLFFEEADEV